MKQISKYYSLILISILSIKTLVDFIDYKKVVKNIQVEQMPIDTLFEGWSLVFFFLVICMLENTLNNKKLKLIIRIYLTIILSGILILNFISIDNLYSGISNTITITGLIAFFTLALNLIVNNKKSKKASS